MFSNVLQNVGVHEKEYTYAREEVREPELSNHLTMWCEYGHIHVLLMPGLGAPIIEDFVVLNDSERGKGLGKKLFFSMIDMLSKVRPDVQVIKVHPVATDLENVSQEEVIEIYQHLATDLDRSDYNIKMVIF